MNMRDIDPPYNLEEIIIKRIHEEKKKSVRMRLVGTSLLTVGSLTSIIPSLSYLGELIRSSGSYEYLSLLGSDASLIASYWKEFTLSVAESFPLLALALTLALCALFAWSLSKTTRNIRLLAA